MKSNKLILIGYLVLLPIALFLWSVFGNTQTFYIMASLIALLACLPFFIDYSRKKVGVTELVILSSLIGLSVVGRLVFAPLSGFKPVSSIVIIAGLAYGSKQGFIVGSMSGLVSNIYFGQGIWTPYQMLGWGLIGVIAGLFQLNLNKNIKMNYFILMVLAVFGGCFYSVIMDIQTVLVQGIGFDWNLFILTFIKSLPFMVIYIVSNIVFLLILAKPILKILSRANRNYML